ncbi:MAG: S8 family serine peptidase, partial [Steroidobacteraceae bacterium]
VLDRDPRGEPIVRGVFLALSPTEAALAAVVGAGFRVQREQALDGLDARVITLLSPPGWSARRGLARLRQLDPQGRYDFNHLYFESAAGGAGTPTPATAPELPRPGARYRVGLIDSGVAAAHPAFKDVVIHPFGCEGAVHPSAHGTAVASLLVVAAPGADLFAADVYCGNDAGGAGVGGLVDSVALALAWMAREGVPVVNISLVGPVNVVFEGVVRALLARGVVIVAAVGNDGPAARPLYPASYDGVIGVTAVDARDKALIEAGRGPQVDLAAPGADILAAAPDGTYVPVRGTSFAAPIVAGLLAHDQSLATLCSSARDLGAPGTDRTYGQGLVGAELRSTLAVNK